MPIDNAILTTENCRYCLMCRHVAPVERVTHLETLSPHGLALLVASVRRGLMVWNADTVDAIYSAADGGNSRAACVTDQPLPEAIAAVRAEIVARRLAPAVVYELDAAFQQWGNPYQRQAPRPAGGRAETALFVGDEYAYLWPGALQAARELLKAAGLEPALIGAGRNNGYLASSLGLTERARELAAANLEELKASGARRLLVLSPGDYFTFRQLYDERLGLEWPERVEIVEVIAFLAGQLQAGALKLKKSTERAPYAYVDPTHAVRVPARHEAPRRLLEAVMPAPRKELFWRRQRAHPAGNTALQFTKPEIAEKLTRARLEDARASGAQLLITEDAGTLRAMSGLASQYGLRIQGLYELLAGRLA